MPIRAPTHRPRNVPTKAERVREFDQARGSAAARGYGRRWQALRKLVLHEQPLCETPGCGMMATDVDHILAKAKGGTDDRDNLRALCHACHSRKTATVDRNTQGGVG